MSKSFSNALQAIATVGIVCGLIVAFETFGHREHSEVKQHLAVCERCGFDPHEEGGPSASAGSCVEMRELLTRLNKPVPLSVDEMIAKQPITNTLHIGVIALPE